MDIWTIVLSGVGAFLGVAAKEAISSISRASAASETARDEDLTDICAAVDALRAAAEAYWCSLPNERPNDIAAAAQITALQHHVGLLYSELFTGQAKRNCDIAFVKLKDAVSGGDFGNPSRITEPRRMVAIHEAALSFRHIAKRERRKLKRGLLA